jgi:hypothetical protein
MQSGTQEEKIQYEEKSIFLGNVDMFSMASSRVNLEDCYPFKVLVIFISIVLKRYYENIKFFLQRVNGYIKYLVWYL